MTVTSTTDTQSEDMDGNPTTKKRRKKRADKRRRERRVSTELPGPLLEQFKAHCSKTRQRQAEALCAAVEMLLRTDEDARVMTSIDARHDVATRRKLLRAALHRIQTCEWRLAPLPAIALLSDHLKAVHLEQLLASIHHGLMEIVRLVAAMPDLQVKSKVRRARKPAGDVSPFKPEEEQRHAG